MMQIQLAGDVVVIVGAQGGIGRAMVAAFAEESCRLALLDCDERVSQYAAEVQQRYGIPTWSAVVDAADCEQVVRAADQAVAALGGCQHVVVTVGVGSGRFGMPFWNLTPHDWPRVLLVNVMACVNSAHAFVPHLLPQRRGSICFLASVAGQIGSPTDPPYSAAKAAVLNFTQCAAKDLAQHNIRVNAICPGMVRTELNQSVWRAWTQTVADADRVDYESWAQAKLRQVAPLGRWQGADEIAAAAVFLASPWAQNMTGQTVNVDGGQVMHF
jgi:NAD(P)-dependent dehydrogenase (short-subunit alcohol dehydrogenase family)